MVRPSSEWDHVSAATTVFAAMMTLGSELVNPYLEAVSAIKKAAVACVAMRRIPASRRTI